MLVNFVSMQHISIFSKTAVENVQKSSYKFSEVHMKLLCVCVCERERERESVWSYKVICAWPRVVMAH